MKEDARLSISTTKAVQGPEATRGHTQDSGNEEGVAIMNELKMEEQSELR
jgi:hypothetical protein